MAIPTNPSLNEEWTNDVTGVTYKWDGERWYIVSTSDAELEEKYVKKAGDTMTGKLTVAKVREDKNSIAFSIAGRIKNNAGDVVDDILLKSYQRVEGNTQPDYIVYYGSTGGTYEVLNRTTAQKEFASIDVVSDALENQSNIEARVATGESIQGEIIETISNALETQGDLVSSLSTLENKVETLEGTVIDGKWYAESRSTPRTGGFDITKGGVQSMSNWDADFIRIHKTDNNGKVFTFAEVGTGDYIRIGAPGSSAVYKITSVPTGSLDWQAFGVEPASSFGTPVPELVYDFEFLPSFDPSAYATIQYVDAENASLQAEVDERVKKTGDTMTGHLKMTRPDATTSGYIFSVEAPHLEDGKQVAFRVTGNGKVKAGHDTSHAFMADDANDIITKQYIDEKVVKTSGTQSLDASKWKLQQPDSNGVNRNFIEIENENMKLFHVQDCTDGSNAWAANKGYVDSKVADSVDGLATEQYVDEAVAAIPEPTGSVPVGSIMIWINPVAPSGWLKLKGGSFDINAYPLLHAYLQQSDGYVSGNLPDWRGHYPGQIGDHLNGDVGVKLPQQTAKPSGGSPRSSSSFNNGENKTANKAGSTDFAGIRKGQVSIDSGWDEVTRPKTVAVHYIIKHD